MPMQLPSDRLSAAQQSSPALEASESRFRNLIENNADGILVVRPDGMIRYANPAATVLLNRPAAELVGQYFGIPIIAGGTTEIDLPFQDGEVGVAEMRVVDTEWEGEPALMASLRDISDRKRLEEQLRQKISELAVPDQRKDEFLAMLAHELRNPLAPILNAVHIMRLRGDDQVLRERMRDVVEQQVRCMARLVDDLLDVSRIIRGKTQLGFEPVSLSPSSSARSRPCAPTWPQRVTSSASRCRTSRCGSGRIRCGSNRS
jgi:signal transduction histidine kinase